MSRMTGVSHTGAVLRLYYFIIFMSFGVFLPFLPPWLEALGITGIGLGAVFALRPILAVFAPILFGILADRFALRGALIRTACIASALSMGGMALLPALEIPLTLPLVLVGMTLFSFFRAPMVNIADVATLEGKKSSYGTIRLFGSAGFLVSALTAGYLLDPKETILFPSVIAGAMLLSFGVSMAIPGRAVNVRRPDTQKMKALLKSSSFRLFLLTSVLWLASHAAYDACVSLHLRDLVQDPTKSGAVVGWAWAIGTLAEIGLMSLSTRLFRRFSPPGLMVTALLGMLIRWVVLALVTDYRVVLATQPLHALSFALFWLAGVEYVRRRAPEGMLATAQGLFSATTSLGGGLSMLLWGPLYTEYQGRGVFTVAAVVASAAFLVSLRLKREPFLPKENL